MGNLEKGNWKEIPKKQSIINAKHFTQHNHNIDEINSLLTDIENNCFPGPDYSSIKSFKDLGWNAGTDNTVLENGYLLFGISQPGSYVNGILITINGIQFKIQTNTGSYMGSSLFPVCKGDIFTFSRTQNHDWIAKSTYHNYFLKCRN